MIKIKIILFIVCCFSCRETFAQINKDTVLLPGNKEKIISKTDTSKKQNNPRIATFRSAVLPGWGQIYNKKYWKLPLVYAALGIPTGLFIYNLNTYKKLRTAYIYRTDTITANDALIDPRFKNLSSESIRTYRNSFRQNMDYCVLFFLLGWGLNVVDATVDAHLKGFDVSDNLSLRILPGKSEMANTTGISFILKFKDKPVNSLSSSVK